MGSGKHCPKCGSEMALMKDGSWECIHCDYKETPLRK